MAPPLLFMHPSMNALAPTFLLASLLAIAPAVARTKLEDSRASVSDARKRVSEIRSQQMSLRQELNGVSARISALKAERAGKLNAGAELDGALKRSQEISGALSELAVLMSDAETRAQAYNLELLTALSEELQSLRGQFDRLQDREARKQIIVKMRALRTDREQVRATLPQAAAS